MKALTRDVPEPLQVRPEEKVIQRDLDRVQGSFAEARDVASGGLPGLERDSDRFGRSRHLLRGDQSEEAEGKRGQHPRTT